MGYWVGPHKSNLVLNSKRLSSWINCIRRRFSQGQKKGSICPPVSISHWPGHAGGYVLWVEKNIRKRKHTEENAVCHQTPLLFCPIRHCPLPLHVLLCCFCTGDEGLLLYLIPCLCEVILPVFSCSFFSIVLSYFCCYWFLGVIYIFWISLFSYSCCKCIFFFTLWLCWLNDMYTCVCIYVCIYVLHVFFKE